MSLTEESTAVALRWGEVWQQGTLNDLDAIFASDVVDHAPSGEGTPGLAALKARWHLLKAAFPDLAFAYQHLIADGEHVVLHWLVSGTHQGAYLGYPATHRRVSWHGTTILRVVQGKITERWTYQDSDSLINQLRGQTPERPEREKQWGARRCFWALMENERCLLMEHTPATVATHIASFAPPGQRERRATVDEQTYLLSFEGVSEAEANRYAEELREVLLDAEASLVVQRQRENPLAQDLGASLALIMGAPAVVAAVQAIGNWLQKRRSASLTIVTAEKKIVVQNLTNKDAAQLLHLFLTQTTSHKEPGI